MSAQSAPDIKGPPPDFRVLFESAPGLYLVLAADLTIVAASDPYLRATHTQRNQIVGRAILDVFPADTSATFVAGLGPSLRRVLETRAADIMATQSVGKRYWRPVNYPVFRVSGEIEYIVHCLEDVHELMILQQRIEQDKKIEHELRTEATRLEDTLFMRAHELEAANEKLRAANQELQRLYQKAQEIYRLKTDLFASVSHELRTPLTLLLGPLDDLLRSPGASISRSDLELMHRNSLRLLKLVNTLLDLARIEAGRLRGDYVPTDLTALTADVASLFRSLIQKAGMKFDLQLEELGQPVYVDRVMWEKIVLNLISNAFKFTAQGGISVSLRNAGNSAQLMVTDTGIGIPETELPHIFERFFRGESSGARSLEGSGIGLSLVHELVKVHGGRIEVQSSLAQGTAFTVSIPFGTGHLPALPARTEQTGVTPSARAAYELEAEVWGVAPEKTEEAATNVAAETEPSSFPGAKPRIVFADDDADMRAYITRLLTPFYEVEVYTNGEEALHSALQRPPDLVLSDFVMPAMDGAHLLRALKSDPRTASVPVILLSVRTEEDSQIAGLEAGADDYLSKPFTTRELLARIKSRIALAQLRDDAQHKKNQREQRFHEILDSASEAILVADAAGRILVFNRTAETMFGYGPSELLGMNVEQFVPEALRQAHAQHRSTYVKEPKMRPMGIGLSLQAQRKDGSLFPAEVGLSPNWSEGELKIIMLVHDVSERRKAEESLRRSEEMLRQAEKLEAIGRLAGGTAHEFNNLLTRVMGYAALLLSALDSQEQILDYVEKISEAARRAGSLTHQLLAFSRRQVVEPQILDLNVVLADVQEVLPELVGLKIETRLAVAPEPACVRADLSQIHQIIVNLVTNARDAMPDGGQLEIKIETRELGESELREHPPGLIAGRYVELAVSDTGIGMNHDSQSRLFEPFFSTKEFGKGAGLGLAAIYGVVQQNRGCISVESEPGAGSTFRILLPRVPDESAAMARGKAVTEQLRGTETLLLAEDDESLRSLTHVFLLGLGYKVLDAASGEEAAQILREYSGPLHLLLTDVVMTGISGREAAAQIKEYRPGIKILYMSGYAHKAFKQEESIGPHEAFLEKPFAFEQLARRIRDILDAPPDRSSPQAERKPQ
jgi:PAS domain S-box-containing protein